MFCRPLRDDEVLPVRTHRIVTESGDMEDEEFKPKKKHKKVKDKGKEEKKKRKEGKEKVHGYNSIYYTAKNKKQVQKQTVCFYVSNLVLEFGMK